MVITGKFNRSGGRRERPENPVCLQDIMQAEVISVGMDATLLEAINLCIDRRIRHLPVISDDRKLVGLLTDRDLRRYLSPSMGTLSENGYDRAALERRAHVVMVRNLIKGKPEMPIAEAVQLLIENRVGCLPIIDQSHYLLGIVTTSDFLRLLTNRQPLLVN